MRQGLIPSSPWTPAYAVSIRTLEVYRITHLRSPQLAIEPFVKALCDLYGASYRSALRDVFSLCFDVYLQLREGAEQRVLQALDRAKDWRRKNACPACIYRLRNEKPLVFDMLTTMDGNDSLKRILRRALVEHEEGNEAGEGAAVSSVEREDGRVADANGDYYLHRKQVDRWENRGKAQKETQQDSANSEGNLPLDKGVDEANPCESRWHNMNSEATAKSWGIFDETGVFVALCRHGFILAVADMVRSGEL